MKKFITYILIFVMSILSPIQGFAQYNPQQALKNKTEGKPLLYFEHNTKYHPAMSFVYDKFILGKTDKEQFFLNLEDDLNNKETWDEELVHPKPQPGVYNHLTQSERVRQAYSEFLYYSDHPQESPNWKYTAFQPEDSEGIGERDVLMIMDKYNLISQRISDLFAENREYKNEKIQTYSWMAPSFVLLVLSSAITLGVSDYVAAGVVAKTAISNGFVKWLIAFAVSIPLLAADIFISEQVAFHIQKANEEFDLLKNKTDFYRQVIVEGTANKSIFQSLKDRNDRDKKVDNFLDAQFANKKISKEDKKLIRTYFHKGYNDVNKDKKLQLKLALGKFLIDYNKQNEWAIQTQREILLRTYYALKVIYEELQDENDPLRYKRAIIDLSTIYKITYINFTTSGIFIKDTVESEEFAQALGYFNVVEMDQYPEISSDLQEEVRIRLTYSPTLLKRAQVNYLVQLMDISRQEQEAEAAKKWNKHLEIEEEFRKEQEKKFEGNSIKIDSLNVPQDVKGNLKKWNKDGNLWYGNTK